GRRRQAQACHQQHHRTGDENQASGDHNALLPASGGVARYWVRGTLRRDQRFPASVCSGTGQGAATAGAGPLGPVHLDLQTLPAPFKVAELALEVRLEAGAVLPLELLELLDVLLQRGALSVEPAHRLLVALTRVPLQ